MWVRGERKERRKKKGKENKERKEEKREKKIKKGKKMRKNKKNEEEEPCVEERRRKREKKKKRNGASLRDLQLTDDRNSSEQDAKLVYAIRATRGYRNPNFSSKFQKIGVSSILVISCLEAM